MAKLTSSLCFLALLLGTLSTSWAVARKVQEKTWCVANSVASDGQLQGFIDYFCSKYSCAEINPGGSCFAPDTVRDHASYALNFYYRTTNTCSPDIASFTPLSPSHDTCVFV